MLKVMFMIHSNPVIFIIFQKRPYELHFPSS